MFGHQFCVHGSLGAAGCSACIIDRLMIERDTIVVMLREVLEALCVREGLSLESTVNPGHPAPNYELGIRLGISEVFGISKESLEDA